MAKKRDDKKLSLVEKMKIISDFPEEFDIIKIPTIMACLYPPIELKRNKAKKTSDDMFDKNLKLVEGEVVQIAGQEFSTHSGFLVIHNTSLDQALIHFNNVAILFNLIEIPISFFKKYDLIIPSIDKEGRTELFSKSKISLEKFSSLDTVKTTKKELDKIFASCSIIWDAIQENDFLKKSQPYEFLARGNMELINQNYRVSFMHSWIFIEALLRNQWEKLVEEKHKEMKIPDNLKDLIEDFNLKKHREGLIGDVRSWSIGVILEILYLDGIISDQFLAILILLKQKRNDIFHFKKSKVKRIIDETTAIKALITGRTLLFLECGIDLSLIEKITFSKISLQINQILHGY